MIRKQHFGGFPGRGAADLAACAAHDIELALLNRRVAALYTLDVKGAFNAVLPNRFAVRLRQQEWPAPVVSLIRHFMAGRSGLRAPPRNRPR